LSEFKFFYRPKSHKKRLKGHSHTLFFLTLFVLIVFSTLYVWQRVKVIKLLKEIREQKKLLAEEEKKYKYLTIETSELSSFERIEKISQEKLALVHPAEYQIQRVYEQEQKKTNLPINLWVKVKNFGKKLYPFEEKQIPAKEIKHDL
jgi:cell division protein FtsL